MLKRQRFLRVSSPQNSFLKFKTSRSSIGGQVTQNEVSLSTNHVFKAAVIQMLKNKNKKKLM